MKFQAHRGVGTEFPENTMPAFEAAAAQEYGYIELDPRFTKDGYLVILHDDTLNRTCRDCCGRKIEEPLFINSINYDEALKYDAGIAKSEKFKGTEIPLLKDVLTLAKQTGVTVKLDNRIQGFNEEQTEVLYGIVEASGAKVGFTSSSIDYIKKVVTRFPNAEIHYDGVVNEENLKTLKDITVNNPLTVWLCLKSDMTSWVKVPCADESLCATVKQYADLGLWILYSDEQLKQAEMLGADIIETTGTLKPKRVEKGIINCHSHTKYSHDSSCEPTDSLNSAESLGLGGFAITDHCDIGIFDETDIKTPILNSVSAADKLGENVLKGIEIGEAFWNREAAEGILRSANFDMVLGSVHSVRYGEYTMPFSVIDFGKFTDTQISEYMTAYFDDMLEMIEKCDFDVLSHLTNPLKYITGKYGRKVELDRYSEAIDKILREIIRKGIALEVNTACLETAYDRLMPELPIIERFKALGGYLLTVGSDAHSADRMGHGLKETVELLKETGFKNLCYFKNRIPIQYEIM